MNTQKDPYKSRYIELNKAGTPAIERSKKSCGSCKTVLPMDAFTNNRSSADGKANTCRRCHSARRKTRYEKIHEGNFDLWARTLIYAARSREKASGVPKDQRLHIASHVQPIAEALEAGVKAGHFKRHRGSGPRRSSATLSRLDHSKPYSGNFTLEVMVRNRSRGTGSPKDLLARGLLWGAYLQQLLTTKPIIPITVKPDAR